MEEEMTGSDHVMIEIRDNQPVVNKNDMVARQWDNSFRNKETSKGYKHERHMEKVPALLLKTKKGRRNREWYKPLVVSLGPYHHNRPNLAQAEKCKLMALEEYCLSTGFTTNFLYNKVFEVVHDARKCYIDGSTNAYSDHEFNQMMLHDGCFILFFIECIADRNCKILINNEHLGTIGCLNIIRDLFLLENQIPFVVLEVLLNLKFPDDKGETILNKFFNYLNYGEVKMLKDKKVLGNINPLHLLELYRSYFIMLSASPSISPIDMDLEEDFNYDYHYDIHYVKQNRSFASVTTLKARWIFLKCTLDGSKDDIEFNSYRFYGEFKLARRAVSSYTKAIYQNMIAYEMCPHNPNDIRISTYIRVMKSLIIQGDDVKELRHNSILLHSLDNDEEVVKMYDEIEVPAVNLYLYNQLRQRIDKLHDSKYKTWVEDLITDYLGSPWKVVGLLVATAIVTTSFLQTYFAINPRDH